MELDDLDLTDKQALLAHRARHHPVILKTRGEKITARSLEKRMWGDVEAGASGETIFRLNQYGEDALSWVDWLKDDGPFDRPMLNWLHDNGVEAP